MRHVIYVEKMRQQNTSSNATEPKDYHLTTEASAMTIVWSSSSSVTEKHNELTKRGGPHDSHGRRYLVSKLKSKMAAN